MSAAKGRARWGWWAGAALWMALIFCASLSEMSAGNTGHFLHWLAGRFHWAPSPAAEDRINFLARKAAHLSEYAVLAVLLHAALRRTLPGWRSGVGALAFALAVLYAAGDEYHQSFVPGRGAALHDVGIDALGAALGLALAWGGRRRPLNQ